MRNKVIAEHGLYAVKIEKVKSQLTLDGTDEIYVVVNKETKVVEGRAATLPDALGFMRGLMIHYERLTSEAERPTPPQPPEATEAQLL